jgi:hypothetical protein
MANGLLQLCNQGVLSEHGHHYVVALILWSPSKSAGNLSLPINDSSNITQSKFPYMSFQIIHSDNKVLTIAMCRAGVPGARSRRLHHHRSAATSSRSSTA